jgi:hypothetical protein
MPSRIAEFVVSGAIFRSTIVKHAGGTVNRGSSACAFLGAFRFSYRVASLGGDLECGGHAAAFERESRFLAEKAAQAMLAPSTIQPFSSS